MCIEAVGGATTTKDLTYRVPPGVTHVNVSALVHGRGTVAVATAADSIGTAVSSHDDSSNQVENARWYSTNGTGDDDENDTAIRSGRALRVRSSVAWTWDDVAIEVEVDDIGSNDTIVLGLIFRPIHVPR